MTSCVRVVLALSESWNMLQPHLVGSAGLLTFFTFSPEVWEQSSSQLRSSITRTKLEFRVPSADLAFCLSVGSEFLGLGFVCSDAIHTLSSPRHSVI